jgi:hypothetical protein
VVQRTSVPTWHVFCAFSPFWKLVIRLVIDISGGITMVNGACSLCGHPDSAPSPLLEARVAETLDLLTQFHDLNPFEAHTLALNLLIIADHLHALADGEGRAEPGDGHT